MDLGVMKLAKRYQIAIGFIAQVLVAQVMKVKLVRLRLAATDTTAPWMRLEVASLTGLPLR
jgi:hypothetical protein